MTIKIINNTEFNTKELYESWALEDAPHHFTHCDGNDYANELSVAVNVTKDGIEFNYNI